MIWRLAMLRLQVLTLLTCTIVSSYLISGVYSDAASSLIKKYSNESTEFWTVEELQRFLNKLHDCQYYSNISNSSAVILGKDCPFTKNTCLSASEVIKQFDGAVEQFKSSHLESVCPFILQQLENNSCSLPSDFMESDGHIPKTPTGKAWGYGILMVTVINLCSLFGVGVLPFMDKLFFKQLLTVLIGLAVGSLSGSSLFHLMPQAFGLMGAESSHQYLNTSLMIWGGVWVFFMIERIMKLIAITREKKRNTYGAQDSSIDPVSSVSSPTELLPHSLQNHEVTVSCVDQSGILDLNNTCDCQHQVIKAPFDQEMKPRTHQEHEHVMHFQPGKDSVIATVAWMVIFGDGLHNFIDGLSIGAAFSDNLLTGVSIGVAVMCEELPHELGDFAVLLNAGMSYRQALIYNFLSACTCYLGLFIGIFLGELQASNRIFGFAAGMFLYIALVDMVPEMNAMAEEASKFNVKKGVGTLVLQNVGIGCGIFALYILALYQDNINFT